MLNIGDGKINPFKVPYAWKTDNICNIIYKNINTNWNNNCVILAPHNDDIHHLNKKILNMLIGEKKIVF